MTTIRRVAKEAGVSASTVSRVFSKPEVVALDARQRVLAAAEALGYRPNPIARSLARGRTGNLGLFVPDIANPFFSPVIKAVQREAKAHDLALFVADSDEDVDDELAQVRAMAQQVDGLVLAAPRLPEDALRQLAHRTPVVLVNREVDGIRAVVTPPDKGLTQAVDHLAELGHRRLLWVGGPTEAYSNTRRLAVVREASAARGLALHEVGPFPPRTESGVTAAEEVLATGATAVVAYNDQIACGLARRVPELGRRVPDDVSVVGIDDSWLASVTSPPLTTVRVPAAEAGAAAVRLLLDPEGEERGRGVVELPTELVVRGSTGPAPSGARRAASTGPGPR